MRSENSSAISTSSRSPTWARSPTASRRSTWCRSCSRRSSPTASASLSAASPSRPRSLAALEADYLKAEGFDTHTIADGREVVAWVRAQAPELILLDLMLPGRDGLEICRDLRSFSDVPIIMVTAKVEEIDRLIGLDLGADDYVCKPFSVRELVARVRDILRRRRTPSTALVLDEERHVAELDGRALDLTPVEFRLLRALASAPGRVFARER